MEEYFRSILEETVDRDDEFRQMLQKQLAFFGLDLDWLLDLAAMGMAMHAMPVPPLLHSLYDGPFEQCLMCQSELLTPPTEYLIVRMFRCEEPIVEYAICTRCNDRQWESYSAETRTRLATESHELDNAVEDDLPPMEGVQQSESEFEQSIARCRSTGKPRVECDVYQITAHCVGTCLAPWSGGPWMRSGEAMRASWKLWSNESRGNYDDFIETYLGPTPTRSREIPRPVTGILPVPNPARMLAGSVW